MPRVGERLKITGRDQEVTVLEVDGSIVVYDQWLPEYKEWNRFIARFNENSAGKIDWNKNVTIVENDSCPQAHPTQESASASGADQ